MKKSPTFKQGFTLIEVLVAIGIFSIITAIAVGGFVVALRTHRQTLSIMAANSNVNYAIERIAREIRTGSNFNYGGNPLCPTSPPEVILCFENSNADFIQYGLSGDSITRSSPFTALEKITDSNVIVHYLDFNIHSFADPYPNRISINVGISPNIKGVDTNIINIQTTVSGRW